MSKLFKTKRNKDEVIETPGRMLVNRFLGNKLAVFGLVLFIIIVLVVLGVWLYVNLTGYQLAAMDHSIKYQAPSLQHWFGTDESGRDMFIRVILGGTVSLQVGFLTTLVTVAVGIILGGIAGYYGGKIDSLIMRFGEIISSFPFLPIAITISVIMQTSPAEVKLFTMMTILGLLGWTGLGRMVRGQILSLRKREFMVATKALGIKTSKQIFRHLMPNVFTFVIVSATNNFAGAILTEATLSFLGLSVAEPIPTWGGLISNASTGVTFRYYWWLWVFPGIMLLLLILSINLIGEGLRDAVDPKSNVEYIKKKRKFSLFKKKTSQSA